jgi:hypothetical protein
MKALLLTTLVGLVALPIAGQAPMPRMTSVEPANGKVGDVLTVAGENLDKQNVAEIYLTDGKTDWRVAVTEQAATAVKIKIPDNAKQGRFSLMILTVGKEPKLIEQPVKVTVE